eukprot:jgi/Ulvmu1/1777/UM118_0017.1
MSHDIQETIVTVVENNDGGNDLVFDGSALPEAMVARCTALRDLLDVEGQAPLPIHPEQFRRWLAFSAEQAYSVGDLASTLNIATFLGDDQACEFAARRLAVVFRRAYRRDVQTKAARSPSQTGTITFPNSVESAPGRNLQKAINDFPPLDPLSAAALVPHLTLCEALILPTPFPALALEHHITISSGLLDLSPPRVPTFTLRRFTQLCDLVCPLLASLPPIRALHLPAPCLHSAATLAPLAPALSSLTRLCITHGRVSYSELYNPRSLPCSILAAALTHLSPTSLRHLSVAGPLKAAKGDVDICRLLGSFTALTYLQIPVPSQRANNFVPQLVAQLTHMALETLSLTHVPEGIRVSAPADSDPSQQRTPLPGLQRFHACGSLDGVGSAASACFERLLHMPTEDDEDEPARLDIKEFKLISRVGTPMLIGTLAPREPMPECQRRCSNCFCTALGDASYISDRVTGLGVVSCSNVLVFDGPPRPNLRTAWQVITADPSGLLERYPYAAPIPCHAPALRVLTMAMHPEVDMYEPISVRVIAAALSGLLRCAVLCVLYTSDLPPRSALCLSLAELLIAPDLSHGWASEGRGGVSHPICAINMLAQADSGTAGSASDSDVPDGPAGDDAAAESGAGGGVLRTLRVSREMFYLAVQREIQDSAACVMSLTDLSVLYNPKSREAAAPQLDLGCVSCLTALRTLALEGVRSVGQVAERLSPLSHLSALRLQGTESDAVALAEFGVYLLPLQSLDCLEVDIRFLGVSCGRAHSSHSMQQMQGSSGSELDWSGSDDGGRDDGAGAGEAWQEELQEEFWEGLWRALRELPLRLGAQAVLSDGWKDSVQV